MDYDQLGTKPGHEAMDTKSGHEVLGTKPGHKAMDTKSGHEVILNRLSLELLSARQPGRAHFYIVYSDISFQGYIFFL